MTDLELVGSPGFPPVISTVGGVVSTVRTTGLSRVAGRVGGLDREGVQAVGEAGVGGR